ncbi:MAG: hypothetical protein GFH24_608290n376 [Chloroflexi bacterium AL-N5]|nr:hypothetical protein [Chloroflexi bacterium AL-N5]
MLGGWALVSNVIVLTAETTDVLQRLTLFVAAEQGEQAATTLDHHVKRPRYQPGFTCGLEQDGALIGYVLLRHVRWRFGAAILDVGMIEALYLDTTHHSQHLLETLLYELFRVCYDNAFALVGLQGHHASFTPFGFAPYRFQVLTQIAVDERPELQSTHRLQSYSTDRMDECAALYEANYRTSALTDLRVAADWRMWGDTTPHIHILEDAQGRTLAYAVQHQGMPSNELRIVEAAAADVGVASSLIDHLQRYAYANNATHIGLALPSYHPVIQAMLQCGGTSHIRTQTTRDNLTNGLVDLAGVIDLPMILSALQPDLERRLASSHYATWSGSIQFVLARQQITLTIANGHTVVEEGLAPAQIWVHIHSLETAAQLLLGYRTSADLRAHGTLQCTDTALGLLDILFPTIMSYGLPADWLINQNR